MRNYSKTAKSTRYDDAILEMSEQYLTSLKLKHIPMTLSGLVRIALTKYAREKLYDDF
jgi:antitoxin component of RelBE/YafQ-DinJ toxin-antitoxin module